jgi:hypothetical protein
MKNVRVATPCQASWEGMAGNERVRHCTLCALNVYNFAEMTRAEIRALLVRAEGRVCARLYRRADGTLLTRDCPSGLRALRQRMSRLATAVIAALFTVSAFASGDKSCEKPRLRTHGSKVKLEIERVATPQHAVFTGVVLDETGSPLPGVTVVLRDEALRREITTITDGNGAFTIASLNDGVYRVEVTLEGFKPSVMEHLVLKQNEITRARVALRIESMDQIMVGAVSDPMSSDAGISTTFSQELINKLPI